MKMINFYVWLMILFASSAMSTCAQDNMMYYCKQYEITYVDGQSIFGKPLCYRSPAMISVSHKEILIQTDSISVRFVVIRRFQGFDKDRTNYLTSIKGQPSQIYAIHEMRDKAGGYHLGVAPTQFNKKTGHVDGLRLDISNREICK